ncbi:MAG: glycosyltransferase [Ignavibacteriaceae bacterium]|nr:glycosyltransferase [Ignavibacteriaceae bacterium]
MNKLPISVIVLTFNEKLNLRECLDSVNNYVDEIIIVDSFSTDNTIEMAKSYTNKIYKNKFVNQAKQFIWALGSTDIKHEWILRLDADERWTKEGFEELRSIIEK